MSLIYDNINKFDNPPKTADQSVKKVNEAFEMEAERRSLASMSSNRVIPWAGTAGTGVLAGATLATNNNTQLATAAMQYMIDGILYSCAALTAQAVAGDISGGTQGTNTTCFWLVSIGGTGGTSGSALYVTKGNDGSAGTGVYGFVNNSTAELPDCPDGYCPVGYMQVVTGVDKWIAATSRTNTYSTYTITFVDLMGMPIKALSE